MDHSFGPDGPGSIDFASMDGTTANLGNTSVTYDWNSSTNTLTAYLTSGTLGVDDVFTVEVTNPTTGAFTFTLLAPLDHPTADTEDNILVDLTYTVRDFDGESTTGTLTVDIDDDIPIQNSTVENKTVEEEHLLGNEDEAGTGDADTGGNFGLTTNIVTGSLKGLVTVGADAPATFSIKTDTTAVATANSGLKSGGETVLFDEVSGVLWGFVDVGTANGTFESGTDREVFKLEIGRASCRERV